MPAPIHTSCVDAPIHGPGRRDLVTTPPARSRGFRGVVAFEAKIAIVSVRVPVEGTHAVATGVMQSRGRPRPSDRSTRRAAALIPQDPTRLTTDTCNSASYAAKGRPDFEKICIQFDDGCVF